MNLDKIFHLKERNTNVKTEIVAGITMFMTMAYILAVNPSILSASGMDSGAVFTATAVASCIGTILIAVFANHPFALAPAMGLNAYFAYTVVLGMGYTWQQALAAIFVEGIIFIILSVTNVREAIFNAIPTNLKHGVSVGIGFFITFIGLQNAKIVVNNDSTLVDMFSFSASISDGSFSSVGISVVLALIGTLITAIFMVKKVKGGILWGVIATWVLGMICQLAGIYVPDPAAGFYSLFPDFSNGLSVPSMAPTFMKVDFSIMKSFDFFIIMFAFLFVDVFDTMGTLIGVASQADLLDEDGKLPKAKGAMLADAIATTFGAICGTSTVTTYVESAAGVAEGGRTGLTAITTAILFALSLFLSPLFLAIPSFATAPALIVVGFLMMTAVTKIDFKDYSEAIPAFIAIMAMPFLYCISEGISLGIISYVVINTVAGNEKRKKVTSLMYVLAILFILKYILI